MVDIRLFESVLESLSDPVTVVDREYRTVYYNGKKAEMFKYPREEIIGKKCFKAYFQRDEPCPKCAARAVLVTEQPCVIEIPMEHPEKGIVWMETRGYPIHDDEGGLSLIIVIGHDITDDVEERNRRIHYMGELERSLSNMASSRPKESAPHDIQLPADLTYREVEVLRLIVEGFTNVEISQILCISAHTVKSHVIHIFNKIDVKDRTQAAVWAVRQNLA